MKHLLAEKVCRDKMLIVESLARARTGVVGSAAIAVSPAALSGGVGGVAPLRQKGMNPVFLVLPLTQMTRRSETINDARQSLSSTSNHIIISFVSGYQKWVLQVLNQSIFNHFQG